MAHYLIGDVQGCDGVLQRLMQKIDFSPSRDTIYPLGDLVNRGPASAQVLRRLRAYGSSAKPILGNHDISLLALAVGVYTARPKDTMGSVLQEDDAQDLLQWLRQQPLARYEHGILMVHAGVLPQWNVTKTLKWADKVHTVLQDKDLRKWLPMLWGNPQLAWSKQLPKRQKLCLAINALTRLRFCTQGGVLDYDTKSAIPPAGYLPWFEVEGRKCADTPIAFGHWSALGLRNAAQIMALDTGCVWGGALTALRIDPSQPFNPSAREIIQVSA